MRLAYRRCRSVIYVFVVHATCWIVNIVRWYGYFWTWLWYIDSWFCLIRWLICVFVCTLAHRYHLKIKSGFIDYSARLFRLVFWWCCKCSWYNVSNKCINRRAVAHKMQCLDASKFQKIAIYATNIRNINSRTHFTCRNCSLESHLAAQGLTLDHCHSPRACWQDSSLIWLFSKYIQDSNAARQFQCQQIMFRLWYMHR